MKGAELRTWRRSERQRLLAMRMAVPQPERRVWGQEIGNLLRTLLSEQSGVTLGVYWPFQAEFDPRPLIDWLIGAGSSVALPAVVDKKGPLEGFDRACYRLGYGGGYFDRTLAALSPRPLAIGVGFELSLIETIYPQDFDMPMDLIVTEACLRRR